MDVDTAKAVGVAKDWDAGVCLDVADELVGATRDDEIDVLVQVKQGGDSITSSDKLNRSVRDLRICESIGNGSGDCLEGESSLFAP